MATSVYTRWNMTTSGSNTNGGAFVAGAWGTDYSVQNSAQYSYTDLAVDATLNTKVSSASHSFTTADIGNSIFINSTSPWTKGFYQVNAASSTSCIVNSGGSAGGNIATGAGGFTTTNANDLLICAVTGATNASLTAGSGYTTRINNGSTGASMSVADYSVSSAATYAPSGSYTNSYYTAQLVAVKASGTPTYVQSAGALGGSTAGTTLSKPYGSNNTSGNFLFVAVSCQMPQDTNPLNYGVTCTVTDTKGNSYTQINATMNPYMTSLPPMQMYTFWAEASSSGANTVTATFSGSVVFRTITVLEYSGVATSTPIDTNAGSAWAILDRSPAATSSTSGTWALGGALADFTIINSYGGANGFTNGNTWWIKSGTYNLTAAANNACLYMGNLGSGSSYYTSFIGYGSTQGDNGTRPLLTTSAASTFIVSISGGSQSELFLFQNLSMSNTNATRSHGIIAQGNGSVFNVTVYNCLLNGFNVGIYGNESTDGYGFPNLRVFNTEIKSCTSHAISNCDTGTGAYSVTIVDNCYLHGNSGSGCDLGVRNGGSFVIKNTVIYSNGYGVTAGSFVAVGSQLTIDHCAITDSTNDGVNWNTSSGNFTQTTITNSIFYNNGGYGLNNTMTGLTANPYVATLAFNNAYGSNTSGAYSNIAAGVGDVTLTADPFTARTSANFGLNSTSGGGPLCKAAGYAGGGLCGTAYQDIGPFQSQAVAGGSLLVNPGWSGGMD